LSLLVRNASSGPNITAGPVKIASGKHGPDRQFALALSDVPRL